MPAQFSVCSLLQESEPETWKISSQLWERSVDILVVVVYNPVSVCVCVKCCLKLSLFVSEGQRCTNDLGQKLKEIKGDRIYRVCGGFLCTTGNWTDWPETVRSTHHCPGLSGGGLDFMVTSSK